MLTIASCVILPTTDHARLARRDSSAALDYVGIAVRVGAHIVNAAIAVRVMLSVTAFYFAGVTSLRRNPYGADNVQVASTTPTLVVGIANTTRIEWAVTV